MELSKKIAIVILALFLALQFALIFVRYFDHDEFEHVHSAWYISKGYRPYTDFFQHHTPLLWYTLLPLISLFGESISVLFAARLLMLLLAVGSLVLLAVISKRYVHNYLLAPALLATTIFFQEKIYEIRPDVPLLFLNLAALYLLLKHLDSGRKNLVILSGVLLGISALFSQKAIFYALSYVVLILFGNKSNILKRIMSCGIVVVSSALSFLAVTLIFFKDNLRDFFTFTITLNSYLPYELYLSSFLISLLVQNTGFTFGVVRAFLAVREKRELTVLVVTQVCLVLLLGFRFRQDYLHLLPIFSIISAIGFEPVINTKLSGLKAVLLILFVIAIPLAFQARYFLNDNSEQIEAVKTVLDGSDSGDFVYDGNAHVNLYRKDTEFFWYSRNLKDIYRQKINLRPYEDTEDEIREKQAAFITDFDINITHFPDYVLEEHHPADSIKLYRLQGLGN